MADLLEYPDRVDVFVLSTSNFLDGPPGSPRHVSGYPITGKLKPPPPTFAHAVADILLESDNLRPDAVLCSLANKHIGLRFTRGADIAELSILAKCPSVAGRSTLMPDFYQPQLKPDQYDRLVALLRTTYPGSF